MRLCPECRHRTESRACEKCGTPTLLESAFTGSQQKPDPLIGQVFDERYTVVDRIGKGGMGSVYRARQLTMGRDVALKVLNPELAEDADSAGRFVREAKVASRLRHPNTIVVYDFGHAPQGLYIAMELLEGESLYQRLRRVKRLDVSAAARIGAAIASSLDEAHTLGIVHRDLKPGNIFLSGIHGGGEVVKVLDFGVARFFQDQATRSKDSMFETNRPMMVGTLQYMAPEQIRGINVDSRADLYALGIMLYEMVAGARPLDGDSPVNTMQRQLEEVPPRLDGSVPAVFADLVARLLDKAADKRPASAAEVAQTLGALAAGTVPELPVARASSRPVAAPPAARPAAEPVAPTQAHAEWESLAEELPPDAMETEIVPTGLVARPLAPLRPAPQRGGFRPDEGGGATATRSTGPSTERAAPTPGRSSLPVVLAVLMLAAAVGGTWFALTRGESARVAAVQPGRVQVTTEPSGAAVTDAESGKALGRTPATLEGVPGAPARLLIALDGYRSATVDVAYPAQGAERTLPVALSRLPSLSLQSSPAGARVIWVERNAALPGETPITWSVPSDALDRGESVEIRFELAGHQSRTERLSRKDLADGRGVSVKLEPSAPAPDSPRGPDLGGRRPKPQR